MRDQRLFGSAYEPILKKIDRFIDLPINEACVVREKRSNTLVTIGNITKKVAEKIREKGFDHPFLQRDLIFQYYRQKEVEENKI